VGTGTTSAPSLPPRSELLGGAFELGKGWPSVTYSAFSGIARRFLRFLTANNAHKASPVSSRRLPAIAIPATAPLPSFLLYLLSLEADSAVAAPLFAALCGGGSAEAFEDATHLSSSHARPEQHAFVALHTSFVALHALASWAHLPDLHVRPSCAQQGCESEHAPPDLTHEAAAAVPSVAHLPSLQTRGDPSVQHCRAPHCCPARAHCAPPWHVPFLHWPLWQHGRLPSHAWPPGTHSPPGCVLHEFCPQLSLEEASVQHGVEASQ
jgi:hypothetical protein